MYRTDINNPNPWRNILKGKVWPSRMTYQVTSVNWIELKPTISKGYIRMVLLSYMKTTYSQSLCQNKFSKLVNLRRWSNSSSCMSIELALDVLPWYSVCTNPNIIFMKITFLLYRIWMLGLGSAVVYYLLLLSYQILELLKTICMHIKNFCL